VKREEWRVELFLGASGLGPDRALRGSAIAPAPAPAPGLGSPGGPAHPSNPLRVSVLAAFLAGDGSA
jgi:hypothetical protein